VTGFARPAVQPSALRLLLWCLAGTALVQLLLWHYTTKGGFSPIFWVLLRAHDTHGNLLLAFIALLAFALRHQTEPAALVRVAGERPWLLAAIAFPLLCLGAAQVYRGFPLSMDEYSTLFQAKIFAAGKLDGSFPPALLDRLIPQHFHGQFFSVARASGEVSTIYWPSFPLLLAPFAGLGVPWMANPLLGALTLPAVHGITKEVTGSKEAAGWALLLAAASPAFVVTSISLYSMPAHLLCNLWFAWLLLRPTPAKAALAGLVGSIALTLHFPLRHVLFAAPFVVWLLIQPGRVKNLGALAAGYLPLGLLLGLGWHQHIMDPLRGAAAVAPAAPGAAAVPTVPAPAQASPILRAVEGIRLPNLAALDARIAGLTKVWTWGAAGLMALAAYGAVLSWRNHAIRLLVAALAVSFFGYFVSAGDQGHGWGNRSLHSAWFILPVLAAAALAGGEAALQRAAAWGILLSLVLANGLRLVQVHDFIGRHLAQVPPLAARADPARPQVVFIDLRSGFYTRDLVQNDPFLSDPRITMVLGSRASAEALMAARFPDYRKVSEGAWGQLWERAAPSPSAR
jgi:hypothetical protein